MAIWNFKRSRPRRVERLLPKGDVPWYVSLRSPKVLWQLALLVAFLAVGLLIVQMPRTPLPFRKGEVTVHPILSRVDFKYIDHEVTANVRELKSLQGTPGLYTVDARQVIAIRESLLSFVEDVAKATAFSEVPEAHRTRWKANAEMFQTLKRALGEGAENLKLVQEAITKATADLAKPLALPIVMEEDYQRASARVARIRDLRKKLPAGLAPDIVPIPEGPTAVIVALLPEEERQMSLHELMTTTQTDRIQPKVERLIAGPLRPIFGPSGTGLLTVAMAPAVGPTLVYDQAETENRRADARAAVEPVPVLRKAGTTLVEAGREISETDLRVLKQEQEARLARQGWLQRLVAWGAAAAVLAVLILLQAVFTARFQPNVARSTPRTLMLIILCLLVMAVAKAVVQTQGPPDAPISSYILMFVVTTAGMIVTIAYSETFAMAVVWSLVLLVAVTTRANLDWTLTAAAGTGVAVLSLGHISNRSKLVKVGAVAGLAFFVTRSALALWQLDDTVTHLAHVPRTILWPAFMCFCGGLAAGIVMLAILPFIERLFGIVTNISLLELCDVNQPALKRLALEAPGTYAHSLLIGTLAEAAAEAIGANGLLARVGAYFHDIGKVNKPRYFVENYQDGREAHSGLAPHMSRLIILSHVKDGKELADRLGLSPVIRGFITEHHGTTLNEYFYHEAKQQAEQAGQTPPVESEYRYPGPKPRSYETAIVMLADAVEGTTRSLKERTPARVRATVHDMIMKRLLDGQLDECGLTLEHLNRIEEALTKTLLSVYHGRVPYPNQEGDEGSEAGASNGRVKNADPAGPPVAEPK